MRRQCIPHYMGRQNIRHWLAIESVFVRVLEGILGLFVCLFCFVLPCKKNTSSLKHEVKTSPCPDGFKPTETKNSSKEKPQSCHDLDYSCMKKLKAGLNSS